MNRRSFIYCSLATSIFNQPDHKSTETLLQRGIRATEIRCYCKILRISFKGHVTNEEVCAKIQPAVGPHEDLLTIVQKRGPKRYGHVSRSSGLTKTILQDTVERGGERRQGRRQKMWEDNVREWTGLKFARSQLRTTENGRNWL